jgi:two-component system, OmpR family, sensor histidine kinase TrcS
VRIFAFRTWPLRKQVVVGVSAVMMTVLVVVGTMSVLTLRSSITGVIDTQLSAAANSFSQACAKYRSTPLPSGALPAPTAMKPLDQLIGQSPGNIVVRMQDGVVVDSAMFSDGEAVTPSPEVLAELVARVNPDAGAEKDWLDGLGMYLMSSQREGPGEVLVTAVSLRPASEAATHETKVVVAVTALGLLITALGTLAIVRIALRPLGRVAATAAEVATLPLNRDQYAITPRVPAGDTDPRTEVGMVGDALNRLLAHVERAMSDVAASDRRMRQFITDASHELRTPLAAIQGYAELTRQDSDVLPHTTEYSLARIEAESARMNSLVSDLLLLARLDEGQDMENAEADIAELAVNAVNDARVSAPDHHWEMRVPDEPVWVHGDRAKLHQAIANLLANAGVHTPAGTTVTTAITATEGSIVLTVTDDGPGISKDLLPHLFERFVRADKSRSRQSGNSGLGLAIAASIVEAHGGAIDAASGGGVTTFTITLPVPAPDHRQSPELALHAK